MLKYTPYRFLQCPLRGYFICILPKGPKIVLREVVSIQDRFKAKMVCVLFSLVTAILSIHLKTHYTASQAIYTTRTSFSALGPPPPLPPDSLPFFGFSFGIQNKQFFFIQKIKHFFNCRNIARTYANTYAGHCQYICWKRFRLNAPCWFTVPPPPILMFLAAYCQ